MIISCQCGARLKVSDEKLSKVPVKVKCPKCGTMHTVSRPQAGQQEQAAAGPSREASSQSKPSMPWFAAAVPPAQTMPMVLIAHDSKAVADLIAGVLAGTGMLTDHAANGLEALKKAVELKPQAMIVDVGLTGIYGFELCERLKDDPETRSIKIILLSSVYGLTAYKRAPVTLYGADDYIEKHHIPDELVPKLRTMLAQTGSEAPKPPQAPAERLPAVPGKAPESPRRPAAPLISRRGIVQAPQGPSAADAGPPHDRLGHPGPGGPPEVPAGDIRAPQSAGQQLQELFEPEKGRTEPPSGTAPAAAGMPSLEDPEGLHEDRATDIPAPRSIDARQPLGFDHGRRDRHVPPDTEPSVPPAEPLLPVPQTPAGQTVPPEVRVPEADSSGRTAEAAESFFEQDEYEAPAAEPSAAASDPEAVEKARRFARLIVSDIALYNQDAVTEGIRDGTFYDLLQDDVAEGRALYEKRVPEPIRATGDYLQEAFDNFIAAKKKLR